MCEFGIVLMQRVCKQMSHPCIGQISEMAFITFCHELLHMYKLKKLNCLCVIIHILCRS